MGKKKITDMVSELAGEYLAENGYELYNTEFVKEGRDWFLRIYIDKAAAAAAGEQAAEQDDEAAEPAYISTDDCEKVSRFLSEKLDESDPIEQNYYLEVSSPGMDRPLITPEHYERYVGHEVEIKLYKAIDGVKNIAGTLESFDRESGALVVNSPQITAGKKGKKSSKKAEPESKRYELTLADIAKANLAVVF
jgi:ribosome maturation factor RimP